MWKAVASEKYLFHRLLLLLLCYIASIFSSTDAKTLQTDSAPLMPERLAMQMQTLPLISPDEDTPRHAVPETPNGITTSFPAPASATAANTNTAAVPDLDQAGAEIHLAALIPQVPEAFQAAYPAEVQAEAGLHEAHRAFLAH